MLVIKEYKELIKELKEQIESLREENDNLREENRDLRRDLESSYSSPSTLTDRLLNMTESYNTLCDINRELKYKLADYENAEKISQCNKREKQ